MHPLTLYQFEYRLALALVLGAVLGIERQLHHKPAGTKTHALVAVGAALFVLLAEDMPGDASATGRVAAQIITGIGFLGAGTILRRDNTTITGLTTAATIWCEGPSAPWPGWALGTRPPSARHLFWCLTCCSNPSMCSSTAAVHWDGIRPHHYPARPLQQLQRAAVCWWPCPPARTRPMP